MAYIDCFDPNTEMWVMPQALPTYLPEAKGGCGVIKVSNQVVVIGGYTELTVEQRVMSYDCATGM